MGLLNHIFRSEEDIAKEIETDDEKIAKAWKEYTSTIPRKKMIILRLSPGQNFQNDLNELKSLLKLELVDEISETREESELIADLESLAHSERIKKIQQLKRALEYAETKYKYAYHLLQELHIALTCQLQLIQKLISAADNPDKLIEHLRSQLALELEIIDKIGKIGTFHSLFAALVKGEHRITLMNSREKRILRKMETRVTKDNGLIYDIGNTITEAIKEKVLEGVTSGTLPGHPEIDFQFVNSEEFVKLVEEKILEARKRPVSKQLLDVYVHLFREWFNQLE